MPPSTAAATIGTRKLAPVTSSKVAVFRTSTTPAIPHSAPDSSQATSMIRSVGTPQLLASEGLVAVARIALPNRVQVEIRCTVTMAATATPMIATWLAVNTIEPKWYEGPGEAE